MSGGPQVLIPPGYRLEERPDGQLEVVKIDELLSKTVAFRVTPSERADMAPFIDSFPSGSIAEALRWLVTHPQVRQVMAAKVEASRTSSATPD